MIQQIYQFCFLLNSAMELRIFGSQFMVFPTFTAFQYLRDLLGSFFPMQRKPQKSHKRYTQVDQQWINWLKKIKELSKRKRREKSLKNWKKRKAQLRDFSKTFLEQINNQKK